MVQQKHSNTLKTVAMEDIFSITDLIPKKKLQEIQDSFAKANQVASTLTDIDGVPITEPSNHSAVCTIIRSTNKGLKNCIRSGKTIGILARNSLQPTQHKCQSIGFTDAAAPIIVNGRHIANWLIGQYSVLDVDAQRVREYALEIGANPKKMVEEFEKMPKLTREEFESKLTFLGLMANDISLMGYQNLVQRQQTEELNLTKQKLEEYQAHLEEKVKQRTTALEKANLQLTSEISHRTKVQQQQARLITAIESAAESIIITSESGQIIYINPAFELLTGYSSKEIIGKNTSILKSGCHDQQFYKNLWETITKGETWRGKFTNTKKDGTNYQDETTISPVKDEEGAIINFVAVKKDITRELEIEQQLQQAKRLESIGILAAGIAHEINTPIQYVLSNTQFVQDVIQDLLELQQTYQGLVETVKPSGDYQSQIETIITVVDALDISYLASESEKAIEQTIEGVNRISDIINSMKIFAESKITIRQKEDLNAIIKSTVTVSRSAWRDHADIKMNLGEYLPEIPLVSSKIKQLLLNMILNASDAIQEKRDRPPTETGVISLTTRRVGESVELRISDTGTGIPENIVGKIFDPFFTTKAVDKGKGQGLSAVHTIVVDNHSGSIKVSSTVGEGTEFIILFPIEPNF